MDFAPLLSTFFLVLITELGDKTMFAVILLSCKYSRLSVLIGSLLALTLISLIGVLVGEAFFELIPQTVLQVAAGLSFILLGIISFIFQKNEDTQIMSGLARYGGVASAFAAVSLLEFGDKSQLSIVVLSAQSGAPLAVLTGAIAAFFLVIIVEVMIGYQIEKRLSGEYIRILTSAAFIGIGIILLILTISGL